MLLLGRRFRKIKRFKKLVFLLVVFAILAAILILLRGNEDDWICVHGSWVKHGMPGSPMPTSICR